MIWHFICFKVSNNQLICYFVRLLFSLEMCQFLLPEPVSTSRLGCIARSRYVHMKCFFFNGSKTLDGNKQNTVLKVQIKSKVLNILQTKITLYCKELTIPNVDLTLNNFDVFLTL